jgi:hypothetical protein
MPFFEMWLVGSHNLRPCALPMPLERDLWGERGSSLVTGRFAMSFQVSNTYIFFAVHAL